MKTDAHIGNANIPTKPKLARPFWRLVLIISLAIVLAFFAVRSTAWAGNAVDCREYCYDDDSTNFPYYNAAVFLGDQTGFGYPTANITGVGFEALHDTYYVTDDTAIGAFTMAASSNYGSYDTAVGSKALYANTNGNHDTATGYQALYSNTDGVYDTADGDSALLNNTNGTYNTANGVYALFSNTSGSSNTAMGGFALYDNNGSYNVAMGNEALEFSSTGNNNTACGEQAMVGNSTSFSTGSNNTASGYESLFSYTTGNYNAATGVQSLYKDTSGGSNTATGYASLYFNTTGSFNTAVGRGALYKNTSSNNVAVGYQALNQNSNGIYNTALGTQALATVTTNSANTAIGYTALNKSTGSGSTAVGENALDNATTGGANIALGAAAGANVTTGSSNIDIGNLGAAESNTIRIGTIGPQTNTYIAGINGVTVAGGLGVIIDSSGHLGTSTSSVRFKENIQPMEKASEAILSLRPVTFRYKKELDPKAIPQFGLVAEQVEKVDPDLVARDDQGKPYSVRYEAVNAMLLNEFLKAHQRVEEQASEIAELKAALKDQGVQLQAVSARLDAKGL